MRSPAFVLVGALAVLAGACASTPDAAPATPLGSPASPSLPTAAAGAPVDSDEAHSGIVVVGTGRITGVPDTFTVDLGISVVRPTVAGANSDAAALAEALVAVVRGHGVPDGDVQTSVYSIAPQYDYRNERQVLIGYRVTNTLTVKVRDLEAAGRIIDDAAGAGGDDVVISGLRFTIEDNEALLAAAREAAWHDARAKAEQLAQLAEVSLGAPRSIVEQVSPPPPTIPFEEMAAYSLRSASTPIEPGSLGVVVTVSVQFEISR